jgi:hypothetical protein
LNHLNFLSNKWKGNQLKLDLGMLREARPDLGFSKYSNQLIK